MNVYFCVRYNRKGAYLDKREIETMKNVFIDKIYTPEETEQRLKNDKILFENLVEWAEVNNFIKDKK